MKSTILKLFGGFQKALEETNREYADYYKLSISEMMHPKETPVMADFEEGAEPVDFGKHMNESKSSVNGARKIRDGILGGISNKGGCERWKKIAVVSGVLLFLAFISNGGSEGDFKQTKPGDRMTLKYDGVEFAFRYCPQGSFMMGSPEDEEGRGNNERQHKVRISEGFWMCETETTQLQWEVIGVQKRLECFNRGANLPVETVSWNKCDVFVKKLNDLGIAPKGWCFALPTEEQWEYACRAGTSGPTYGVPLDDCAWHYGNCGGQTFEVGMKNPNPWGIYDMLGNVNEWTNSKHGSLYAFRGGGWFNEPSICRPAFRVGANPTFVDITLGLRICLVRR